jgi:hypothetical protein
VAAAWHMKGPDGRIWLVREMIATGISWILFVVPEAILGFCISAKYL